LIIDSVTNDQGNEVCKMTSFPIIYWFRNPSHCTNIMLDIVQCLRLFDIRDVSEVGFTSVLRGCLAYKNKEVIKRLSL